MRTIVKLQHARLRAARAARDSHVHKIAAASSEIKELKNRIRAAKMSVEILSLEKRRAQGKVNFERKKYRRELTLEVGFPSSFWMQEAFTSGEESPSSSDNEQDSVIRQHGVADENVVEDAVSVDSPNGEEDDQGDFEETIHTETGDDNEDELCQNSDEVEDGFYHLMG